MPSRRGGNVRTGGGYLYTTGGNGNYGSTRVFYPSSTRGNFHPGNRPIYPRLPLNISYVTVIPPYPMSPPTLPMTPTNKVNAAPLITGK
jgi:hypothetical protein